MQPVQTCNLQQLTLILQHELELRRFREGSSLLAPFAGALATESTCSSGRSFQAPNHPEQAPKAGKGHKGPKRSSPLVVRTGITPSF